MPYKEDFVAPAAGRAVPGQSALSGTSWIAAAAESLFAQGHVQRGGERSTRSD